MSRKLASIRVIDNIAHIEGADMIECATIGGWNVVVKKGEFITGQFIIYFEVDSWIPTELASFLSKGQEPSEYNGIKGERLRTIKLRKQISQGLILSTDSLPDSITTFYDGMDLTELLNIQLYEKPLDASLGGVARGNFPSYIPKTNQPRIQNFKTEFNQYKTDSYTFEVSEKLEGCSMTVYYNDGVFGVCSRNIDLKETAGNAFWNIARELLLEEFFKEHNIDGIAIQGELLAPNIQGNIYKLSKPEFRVFDVFSITEQRYFTSQERIEFITKIGIKHVPVLVIVDISTFNDLSDIITFAEGISMLYNTQREGVVFKCVENPSISFKAISNKYLLKSQ